MRILIVLPRQEQASGNEVTATRHRDGLVALGHQVELARVAPEDGAQLRATALTFAPDVVHLLHAYRSGKPWLEAGLNALPYLVTLTGTDINRDIDTLEQGPIIRRLLAGAGKVIVLNLLIDARLRSEACCPVDRIAGLPPGIALGNEPSPWSRAALAPPGTILFLHPAGIRPVKGNRELLDLFDPLAASGLSLAVAFCGPILDPDYSVEFMAAIAVRPWARYLGIIPPGAMPATLRLVDVVLNNSESEGLPNALLEAAALGLPMLARAIPGNAAVVEADVNGLFFHDPHTFRIAARALCEDDGLRHRLATPRIERYSPEVETSALLALYREVVESGCKG